MNNNKNFFFIFIASIIVGMLISMNFDFSRITSYSVLDSSEYAQAVEKRNTLYKDIDNIQENNLDMKRTIDKYKREDEQNEQIVEDMKNQINEYNMFNGADVVEGPGIILRINDGETDYSNEDIDSINSKLLHDSDMALVLNELRNAGAQAICVNNHRVVPWSGVICNWAFIGFDDASMEYSPFSIYAIGDPEKLKASLLEDGSHINQLIIRKLNVSIETTNKIKMPSSSSNGIIQSMKRDESTHKK